MIEFRHVSKDFHGKVVLSDISMEIPTGELTVLIGPSGCGKTTTLKMINRLLSPSSGEIWIDGKNIETLDKVQLRRRIGYVIQQGGLFPHMTIRENIEIIARLRPRATPKPSPAKPTNSWRWWIWILRSTWTVIPRSSLVASSSASA